jgi:hypothetical protein
MQMWITRHKSVLKFYFYPHFHIVEVKLWITWAGVGKSKLSTYSQYFNKNVDNFHAFYSRKQATFAVSLKDFESRAFKSKIKAFKSERSVVFAFQNGIPNLKIFFVDNFHLF